ncbi:unnamed protein product [Oreochromis niloticus]|nr:unnamed protein product [Mustela putorius furo]
MKTWRQRNMIAAVLLLCVVGALCSDDMGTPACGSSYEAACLTPADYLNRSGPISKVLAVGEKLIISLEGLSGSPVCHWIRGEDRVMTANKVGQWSFKGSDGKTESKISSTEYYNRGMMCCATNAEGQECSQLYDYDLQSSVMNKDEVSTVTLSKGQSLLLRCRVNGYSLRSPVWEKGGSQLNARTLSCKPEEEEEMCIKNDSHYKVRMAYLSIRSVREEHNGTYTCTSTDKTPKSIYVHVSG